ncbi:ISCpe7, transposase [Clostridium tetani]|nr:ISCpe7, transposase [Clostridium tetani]
MNKSKIQCPRCNSTKLYKFGFDKQANQKYQCKECKRQFAPGYANKSLRETILNALGVDMVHTYIIDINIIIAISAIIENAIILLFNTIQLI